VANECRAFYGESIALSCGHLDLALLSKPQQ
jgi:hypothetical protein